MLVILEGLVSLLDPDGWTLKERRKGETLTLESHDQVSPSLISKLTRAFFNVQGARNRRAASFILGKNRPSPQHGQCMIIEPRLLDLG